MKRIIVVGGGIGGLTAAALLGAAGHHVTVLEAADHLGGKSRRIESAGQALDTGPSLVTFPAVWAELLNRFDALRTSAPGRQRAVTDSERDSAEESGSAAGPHSASGSGAAGSASGARSAAQISGLDFERLPDVGTYHWRGTEVTLPVPPGHPWHQAWARFEAEHGGLGPDITRLLTTPPLDRRSFPALGRLGRAYGLRLTTRSYLDGLHWMPEGLREIIAIHPSANDTTPRWAPCHSTGPSSRPRCLAGDFNRRSTFSKNRKPGRFALRMRWISHHSTPFFPASPSALFSVRATE